jgi:hypothetical protein
MSGSPVCETVVVKFYSCFKLLRFWMSRRKMNCHCPGRCSTAELINGRWLNLLNVLRDCNKTTFRASHNIISSTAHSFSCYHMLQSRQFTITVSSSALYHTFLILFFFSCSVLISTSTWSPTWLVGCCDDDDNNNNGDDRDKHNSINSRFHFCILSWIP